MEASPSKWIVGAEPFLGAAQAAWRALAPDTPIVALAVGQDAAYAFDLSGLEAMSADAGASAFVAFGPQFLNLRRFELMGLLKERGLSLPPLVTSGAMLVDGVRPGENSWIGAGAILGAGTRVGFNCFVGAGVLIGEGGVLGNSCWIEAGAVLGRGCKVGANAIIGRGVILDDGAEVGRGSVLTVPGHHGRGIPARTFVTPEFDEPVVVVGG